MWGPPERACHDWSCCPYLPLRVCVWFGWLPALLMLVLGACLVLVGCSVCVCVCARICVCVCGFKLRRGDSMQTRCVTRAQIFERLITINFFCLKCIDIYVKLFIWYQRNIQKCMTKKVHNVMFSSKSALYWTDKLICLKCHIIVFWWGLCVCVGATVCLFYFAFFFCNSLTIHWLIMFIWFLLCLILDFWLFT